MSTALVVEDTMTDVAIVKGLLQQMGWSVVVVHSGADAMKQLSAMKPDLIVLDVILPDQSGFEICRAIKNSPDTKGIPVFMCSTKNTDVDKMWGNMLGAAAYLSKPLQEADLTQALKTIGK